MAEQLEEPQAAEPSNPSDPGAPRGPREAPAPDFLVLVDRAVNQHLVLYHEPQSALAEQYRTFRTNLVAMNPGGAPRALALTSTLKGEGKSITTANLALALAELPDTRVLVVDADLRAPTQAQLFGVPREPGLADVMLDFAPLDRAVARTTVAGLSVLPAGRPVRNPSEILGSARLSELVTALKAEFNYILFDTPPALPFADAAVLGHRVDGLLFVVRMERTPKDQVSRSLETLKNAGCNVVGCFLAGNRSEDSKAREYVIPED